MNRNCNRDTPSSTEGISIYDLMGENYEVYVKKNNTFGFDITIENEQGDEVVNETQVHRCALQTFVASTYFSTKKQS